MNGSLSEETPESICMEREVKETLLMACRRLKPPYNEIAQAYYYEEMEVKEIAEKRGQKIKTVQTQLYRARDMLRKIYRKENSA